MVQSVIAPDGEFNAEQLVRQFQHLFLLCKLKLIRSFFHYFKTTQWKEVKPEDLMDSKLRCVFEFPDENKATADDGK